MNIELLAPAGNFESLIAAVESGADAVYLGGTKYNARASANNFDEETLIKAVKYAHIRNVKIYITVNILISDDELEDALKYTEFLYNNDIDGIIIQDIGLLYLINKFFPEMPLHCSTQMTIHNRDGVNILRGLGADRFVLAREMDIKEISGLVKDTSAEIEIFIHGALCVSYSGQCLMSSLIGGRSGNRGKCAQPCRKAYTLIDMDDNKSDSYKKAYLLSTKDLNTIKHLDEIIRAGVKSLKIEGRMKRPEYVAVVVKHYKEALNNIIEKGKAEIDDDVYRALESAFNRGFTHGFLFNEKKSEIVNTTKPSNRGILLGKVLWQKDGKAGISVDRGTINKGDGIEIVLGNGVSTGFNINSAERDAAGALIINADKKLTPGLPVYKTFDKALNDKAIKEYFYENRRKVFLSAELFIRSGNNPSIKIWDHEGHNVELQSAHIAEIAEKASITEEKAIAQLKKTGDTPYIFEDIKVHMDSNVYAPMSVLNELRRDALKAMDEALSCRNKRKDIHISNANFRIDIIPEKRDDNKILFGASLWKYENIKPAIEAGIDYVYYGTQDRIPQTVEFCHENNTDIFFLLPNIIKDGEIEKYRKIIKENNFDGIVISNISQLSFANIKPGLKVTGNYSLNVFNKRSLEVYMEMGAHVICPSVELALKQIKPMAGYYGSRMELMVYGQLPLMTMEYCPLSSSDGCKDCSKQSKYGLKDERGAVFPIYCNDHKTQLLNSHILFMAEYMNRIIETGVKRFRMDFYREKTREIKEIIELYKDFRNQDGGKYVDVIQRIKNIGHTKGHYFRGVD